MSRREETEWKEIDHWLATKFHERNQEVPVFERSPESAQILRSLVELNHDQDKHAQETLLALEKYSEMYCQQDNKTKEVLQAFGVSVDQLTPETRTRLKLLAELVMLLGISDLSLPSFQHGFSHLALTSMTHASSSTGGGGGGRSYNDQIQSLDNHIKEAQQELQELQQLRDKLSRDRDTIHDMELRNKRRSQELMRQHDQSLQLKLESEQRPVDIEEQGLTVTQIKAQEAVVEGLQSQLNEQTRQLAAYQEIPPDYTLATLKLSEAESRLEQLTQVHESMAQQLADAL
ncbi:hypothetical protein BGZ94_009027 [Podila epigama]|nr:hypothetical protein BGZ94_009027 [Podila epigama]